MRGDCRGNSFMSLMARRAASVAGGSDILETLLRSRPQDREFLHDYVRRAKTYHNECGCAMSGIFLVGASLFLVLDFLWLRGPIHGGGPLFQLFAGVVFIFGSAVTGKLIGVGIARIRLALLYRDLRIRFEREGC